MTQLLDHLWQSSLFALAVGLLTLAFRHRAARVRFWLWFTASLKFLVPFAALALVGEWLARLVPAPLPSSLRLLAGPAEKLSTPVQALAPAQAADLAFPLLLFWSAGVLLVLAIRLSRWLKLRALVKEAQALSLAAPVEVRSSSSLLEPGLVGILKPVVLLPRDLLDHLSPAERDGILAHELSHFAARDNLTAALHMAVEALFWFWPPVWLIGGRLIAERERACDERVLAAGHDPEIYAGGILKVCRFCIQSPLACAAGASGADLSLRVRQIMSGREASALGIWDHGLLTGAALLALALPVLAGFATTPLAVTVSRQVIAVQVRASAAMSAMAEQIGILPMPRVPVEVRVLPRVNSAAAPLPPMPQVQAIEPAPAEQPAPVLAEPQAQQPEPAPLSPAKEVVRVTAPVKSVALDPRGEGDPDAVTCRAPQALPGSRLPGPEVCQPNRFWAALYADKQRLAPDGRTLIAANERFGLGPKACPPALFLAASGVGMNSNTLSFCR